ncbi:2509_t:CDS:1, partial [Dentiscutata heterogama]
RCIPIQSPDCSPIARLYKIVKIIMCVLWPKIQYKYVISHRQDLFSLKNHCKIAQDNIQVIVQVIVVIVW